MQTNFRKRNRWRARIAFGACALAVLVSSQPHLFAATIRQAAGRLAGAVTDASGAPVAGARVVLESRGAPAERVTDDAGRFVFEPVEPGPVVLRVRAAGFARLERAVTAGDGHSPDLDFVLAPAGFSEEVTVTATRTERRLGDTAASAVVLTRADLESTAAVTIDDALRQVPGFSLFRRTGSRTANPTAQGVSLRGVGASGASRALVLADGIPLNDPFGGWVYWGRVPRESVDRIEVVRGGASDLYGSAALGGVINILTDVPRHPAVSLEASYGTEDTADFSISAGRRFGDWGLRVSGEGFRTDGYVNVDESIRGAVDTPTASERAAIDTRLDWAASEAARVFVRAAAFREARDNGTPIQTNDTRIDELSLGGDWRSPRAGAFALRAYASTQTYNQAFSAIASNRDSEALTRRQRVPAQAVGGGLQWSRPLGDAHDLAAGVDAREVRGASDEIGFFGGLATVAVGAGGRERALGGYVRDLIQLHPQWLVVASARVDRWSNVEAFTASRALGGAGATSVLAFPDRSETAFSPRLSVLFHASDRVSLYGAAYRAFRAPTLNELYRSFRVGNVLTLSNEQLRAERLTGGEFGVRATLAGDALSVRGTVFWSEIVRPIANVTLDVSPELITRQRQNLGRTRSRGLEIETDARLSDRIAVTAGYQFLDATVRRFPANLDLEGLRIPQIPDHQVTVQARYAAPSRLILGVQCRLAGAQYDDDQNRLRLGGYFTLDARASYPLASGVRAFVSSENVLNRRFAIGRTPVETLGPPAFVRFGISVDVGSP